MNNWFVFALLSAFFASLTAIFAKIGIKGVDSDLATAIRTIIILLLAWGIVFFRSKSGGLAQLSRYNGFFLYYLAWPRACRGYFILGHCRLGKHRR